MNRGARVIGVDAKAEGLDSLQLEGTYCINVIIYNFLLYVFGGSMPFLKCLLRHLHDSQ